MSAVAMAQTVSAIWQGSVRHRRFAPRAHAFSYSLFMLGLDLDELPQLDQGRWFGVERSGLLSFNRHDYLKGSEGSLKQAVWQKVSELGGDAGGRHEAVGQPILLHCKGNISGQRRVTDLSQHAHVDEMVFTQPLRQVREAMPDLIEDDKPLFELDPVPLAIVESDRLDMRESL